MVPNLINVKADVTVTHAFRRPIAKRIANERLRMLSLRDRLRTGGNFPYPAENVSVCSRIITDVQIALRIERQSAARSGGKDERAHCIRAVARPHTGKALRRHLVGRQRAARCNGCNLAGCQRVTKDAGALRHIDLLTVSGDSKGLNPRYSWDGHGLATGLATRGVTNDAETTGLCQVQIATDEGETKDALPTQGLPDRLDDL